MQSRRPNFVLILAAATLLALLAGFGFVLADSQSKSRRDVESRFRDRAKSSAALTESLFGSTSASAQAENAKRYGGAQVSAQKLAAQAKQGNSPYLLVLSSKGKVIASSPGTTAAVKRAIESKPSYIREALGGRPFALSDVQRTGKGGSTLVYAQSFQAQDGRRVLVSGLNAKLIHQFLGGYLKQVPNVTGGHAYVLDRNGRVVASPEKGAVPGAVVQEPGLVKALARGDEGAFGNDRYRVSDTVAGTPWTVVLTAPSSELFAPVNGTRKWVPWVLLVGFGIAAGFALLLLRRVLRDSTRLEATNTKLAGANQALERRAQELSQSNEHLDRFASIASHDLQEPLRKLQTFAERLTTQEGDRLSDGGRDYLTRMSDAARRMQSMIDGLLAFSRTRTMMHPTDEVDLEEVVNDIVNDLDLVINESGATVEVGSLATVPGDSLRLHQLFQNLVSNAIKFHRAGVPPVVRIAGQTRGDMAEITVTDNGIGFEQRFSERIFRVFERLHGRGEYPGTGIGLALCRRIAEYHGGSISAASTSGQGSTFTVMLPLTPIETYTSNGEPNEPAAEERSLVNA